MTDRQWLRTGTAVVSLALIGATAIGYTLFTAAEPSIPPQIPPAPPVAWTGSGPYSTHVGPLTLPYIGCPYGERITPALNAYVLDIARQLDIDASASKPVLYAYGPLGCNVVLGRLGVPGAVAVAIDSSAVDACAELDASKPATRSAPWLVTADAAARNVATAALAAAGKSVEGFSVRTSHTGRFWVVRFTPPDASQTTDKIGATVRGTTRVVIHKRTAAARVIDFPFHKLPVPAPPATGYLR